MGCMVVQWCLSVCPSGFSSLFSFMLHTLNWNMLCTFFVKNFKLCSSCVHPLYCKSYAPLCKKQKERLRVERAWLVHLTSLVGKTILVHTVSGNWRYAYDIWFSFNFMEIFCRLLHLGGFFKFLYKEHRLSFHRI